jgi:serine/threonine protein kinase
MATHYQNLNVDPRASIEVIQAAFRTLALKYHPDHMGGSVELFRLIDEARHVLSDPTKRREYDSSLKHFFDDKKVIGSYEILKFIAEGAMGRTYLARHLLTKKLSVIKACLKVGPEYEALMMNEASAIWDIRHYAFPAIREVMRLEDGAIGIVQSYVPGPTLEQVVKQIGALEPEHVGWIFERLLAGLNYLHANGVIHGDIKPQNIIIQPESHGAVMVDFGLSMIKPTGKDSNMGYTDHFSPPEQRNDHSKPLIPESDLFALGMTMAYLLTGKMVKRTDPLLKNSPKELVDFIKELTHPDVLKRPNWESNLLQQIGDIRTKCFGTRNTRGKLFPAVKYDTVK